MGFFVWLLSLRTNKEGIKISPLELHYNYFWPHTLPEDKSLNTDHFILQLTNLLLFQILEFQYFLQSADMASDGSLSVVVSTSPKHGNRDAETVRSSSPKGQCLCSPTMHQGSFRCRLHRSTSSAWMKRSKSMPANNPAASLSPKESIGSS